MLSYLWPLSGSFGYLVACGCWILSNRLLKFFTFPLLFYDILIVLS